MERSSTRSRLPTMYYNVSGQVIEASGLRGELGKEREEREGEGEETGLKREEGKGGGTP